MLKCLDCLANIKVEKVAVFVGGVLFGTAGLKVLGSKDAKKAYVQGTAAVLRGFPESAAHWAAPSATAASRRRGCPGRSHCPERTGNPPGKSLLCAAAPTAFPGRSRADRK